MVTLTKWGVFFFPLLLNVLACRFESLLNPSRKIETHIQFDSYISEGDGGSEGEGERERERGKKEDKQQTNSKALIFRELDVGEEIHGNRFPSNCVVAFFFIPAHSRFCAQVL